MGGEFTYPKMGSQNGFHQLKQSKMGGEFTYPKMGSQNGFHPLK